MGVDVSGVIGAASSLEAHAASMYERAAVVTTEYATIAKSLIRARAPRGSTGDADDGVAFADSFKVDSGQYKGAPSATVGTDKPQGFRLEMGFHGTDRAGRRISQSPNPTVGPVADETAEPFWSALANITEVQ